MEKKKSFHILLRDPDSNIHIFIVTKITSSDYGRACVLGVGAPSSIVPAKMARLMVVSLKCLSRGGVK